MSRFQLWRLHCFLRLAYGVAYAWRKVAPISGFDGFAGESKADIETLESFLLDWMHRVREIQEAARAR